MARGTGDRSPSLAGGEPSGPACGRCLPPTHRARADLPDAYDQHPFLPRSFLIESPEDARRRERRGWDHEFGQASARVGLVARRRGAGAEGRDGGLRRRRGRTLDDSRRRGGAEGRADGPRVQIYDPRGLLRRRPFLALAFFRWRYWARSEANNPRSP